jgi:elongation factor G
LSPKTKSDQEKLGVGLAKLKAEDPTFHVKTDEETGQVVIAGMGELHLEIIVDRLKREFSVGSVGRRARRSPTRKRSRAPPKAKASGIKQSGGRGQYGHAKIASSRASPAKATSS